MYRSTVVLICIAVAVQSAQFSREEGLEAFKALAQNCMTEVQASQADLDSMIANLPNASKPSKCLRKCLMNKFELLLPDGSFSVARLTNLADTFSNGDPEKVKNAREIGNACSGVGAGSPDLCEKAYLHDKCIRDELAARKVDINY